MPPYASSSNYTANLSYCNNVNETDNTIIRANDEKSGESRPSLPKRADKAEMAKSPTTRPKVPTSVASKPEIWHIIHKP